jgi:signal transduction histidine kinase
VRLLAGAAAALSLLVLLTWLLLRGIGADASEYALILQAFDDYVLAEASLHRDVLEARAGLLRDYDPLVKAVVSMEDVVERLRSYARTNGLDARPVDRLAAAVAQQGELTERFKTTNAILQNSLSYVGLLTTDPVFGAEGAQFAPAIGALAAAILHLTHDTSPDIAKALRERIEQIALQVPSVGFGQRPGPDAAAAKTLLAHARLLHDLLPAVDDTLKSLIAVPSGPALDEARALFARHQSALEATARRFRLFLYLVSLLLLVMLVRLGLRLRARALALRRRAAFEHVLAQNSTRLISCPPAETETRLKQVLGELCRAIGVERAYVVFDDVPPRVIAWCAEGTAYPPGWPDQALALAARLDGAGSDIVTIPDIAALSQSDLKDALATVGVRGWAFVPLIRPGRLRGILGFDAFLPAWKVVFPLPVVRLAGDAVASAIEREFLERERTKLTTRLERADRMQIIGSLASGIAHNFNNIIAAILGYSEMVEPQLLPGSKPARQIEEIRRAAERGRDLIDNILTFGRRRVAQVQAVQVRPLLDEAASLLRATLPSGIELVIDDVPSDVAVSGEPAQLQQVILNLCTNAAQAIEGSGAVRVTAACRDTADPALLSHGRLPPGRYVCLSVVDTGRGFDEGVARRLFEPFFTSRAAGTGLGLATVLEIVRDHNGAMNVESKPGFGSRFEAWLPATTTDGTTSIGPSTLPLGRGETVLVVESERERLRRDEDMLAALGYEPVGFERPAEAFAAYRAAPDRFDIIMVGNGAQTVDGRDLAWALHQVAPQRPLLLTIESASDVSVEGLAEAGISEVLRRPLVSSELAAALVRCLRAPGALQMHQGIRPQKYFSSIARPNSD